LLGQRPTVTGGGREGSREVENPPRGILRSKIVFRSWNYILFLDSERSAERVDDFFFFFFFFLFFWKRSLSSTRSGTAPVFAYGTSKARNGVIRWRLFLEISKVTIQGENYATLENCPKRFEIFTRRSRMGKTNVQANRNRFWKFLGDLENFRSLSTLSYCSTKPLILRWECRNIITI